jgi:hypothetical protein
MLLYKIDAKGHRAYIGDYGSGDLERSASIEMFIKDWVVPHYGAGEFIVEIRKPDGKVDTQGAVSIMSDQQVQQKKENASMLEMFELQRRSSEEADRKAKQQSDNMMAMFTLLKDSLVQKGEGKSDGGMGMVMMMMQMMMQQMSAASRPSGPDPMTQMMMQKLMSRLDEPAAAPLPPFPPLPPPVPNPTESMSGVADIVKVVAETMKASQPQSQQNDLLAVLVKQLVQPDKSGLNAKDVVEMLPTIRDILGKSSEGSTTFNDYLEGLMRLDEIRGGGQQEDHSILAGLGEAVLGVVRDIKMQEMQMEMIKSGKLPREQERRQLPRRQRTGAVAPIEESEEPEQEETPRKPRSKVPKIPVGFRKFSIRMQTAAKKGDEPALVMALFEGLLHLRENSEQWAPYIEEFMMAAGSEGEKDRALHMLKVFLHTFAKVNLIPTSVIGLTMKTITENWETIIEQTGIAAAVAEEVGAQDDDEEPSLEDIELEEEEDDEIDLDSLENLDEEEEVVEEQALVTDAPATEEGPNGPGLLDEQEPEEKQREEEEEPGPQAG